METSPESQRLDCGIIASGRRRERGEKRNETAQGDEIPTKYHLVAGMGPFIDCIRTIYDWHITELVILILTKLYDFNLGSVTESSLWRSTDYGTTYEKLNDKVGLKTVLSYLYVNPTNKRKIMLLSDPEMESSLLISSDEGATYQKYRLTFYIQSLLFHPKQEDWVLAYSLDQKLYSSMDFGRRWQLVHERITPNRFYW
ncbi:VPS10 domain-containing receptor SorCS3-like [Panthera uncia]|uniref:VPS10 domain-containing receptor SorCS3-like n=1 Tax=Panthera uncia TaxID=29064 RepID=UPI0020FFE31E|nr:VPS10 domain-containing receptor SorCS3-like [Panthera uncia]